MKVVYVAGPFRGANSWEMEENIRRAERIALEVWRLGVACICPHTNTRFFQGAAPDNVWLDGDLELIKRCDIVLMTPDWQRSMGATAEHDLARSLGMIIVYSLEELKCLVASNHTVPTSTPSPAAPTIPANGATQLDLFQTSPNNK